MASSVFSYMACTKFSMASNMASTTKFSIFEGKRNIQKNRSSVAILSAQSEAESEEQVVNVKESTKTFEEETTSRLRPAEVQVNVKSKNMDREYGGEWLSSTTRHVRIFAAYIDPETWEFDQTQMDKLTILLDPTDEFLWTEKTRNMVFQYFQDLVDHYEGAPLTEYTLRLIGSDIEHYIRKLLYDGEIQYNMNARVLNFSMGKPRVHFNYDDQIQK